jgi:hypothetical protein
MKGTAEFKEKDSLFEGCRGLSHRLGLERSSKGQPAPLGVAGGLPCRSFSSHAIGDMGEKT